MNFSYVIEGQLAGSADPARGASLRKNLVWLYEQGIRSIVSLTVERPSEALLAESGFSSLHLPVRDFTPPTPAQIREGVKFIRDSLERQNPVLVHCASGFGRTGTLLACYLVSMGMTWAEAIDAVREERPGSIETVDQEEAVRSFAESLEGPSA